MSTFRDQILVRPDFLDQRRDFCPGSNSRNDSAIWVYIRIRLVPWHDSCPDFPDLVSRLSRLKLSARLCILGLNPDAARPLVRLMSRHSRPYVQTFQTQTLGATLQFGSKSGYIATIGAFHVQTSQTLCPDFPDSNSR